tara:strand:- start:174 stop:368 length:195 start_codon:yes stop_codon:yes gene_type:complete
MKRIFPFIALAFLTGFTATSGLPVMAGSCSNHENKTEENNCVKDDIECQNKKVEKYGLNKTVKS